MTIILNQKNEKKINKPQFEGLLKNTEDYYVFFFQVNDSRYVSMATGGGPNEAAENYILIDVGANLTNKKFTRDLDSVIQRAKDAGNKIK